MQEGYGLKDLMLTTKSAESKFSLVLPYAWQTTEVSKVGSMRVW